MLPAKAHPGLVIISLSLVIGPHNVKLLASFLVPDLDESPQLILLLLCIRLFNNSI